VGKEDNKPLYRARRRAVDCRDIRYLNLHSDRLSPPSCHMAISEILNIPFIPDVLPPSNSSLSSGPSHPFTLLNAMLADLPTPSIDVLLSLVSEMEGQERKNIKRRLRDSSSHSAILTSMLVGTTQTECM